MEGQLLQKFSKNMQSLTLHLNIGENFILIHNNARPHTSKFVTNYLLSLGITVMDWSAVCPHLNAIQHVWDKLGRRVRNWPPLSNTLEELRKNGRISYRNSIIRNLIMRMDRRMNRYKCKRRQYSLLKTRDHLLLFICRLRVFCNFLFF